MKTIATINQKGGVGKTTINIEIARLLAKDGNRICLIDLDNQSNLSSTFGYYDDNEKLSSYDLFVYDFNEQVIQKTENNRIDIIISNYKSIELNNYLLEELFKIKYNVGTLNLDEPIIEVLKRQIKNLEKLYDYVLIDCPATINEVIKAALVASDYVIVPINADEFSIDGVIKLTDEIETVKLNNDAKVKIKMFMNKFERHIKSHQESKSVLKKYLGSYMCDTSIPKRKLIQENVENKKDIFNSKSRKALYILEQYRELVKEII